MRNGWVRRAVVSSNGSGHLWVGGESQGGERTAHLRLGIVGMRRNDDGVVWQTGSFT